jgi:hypothetical protein
VTDVLNDDNFTMYAMRAYQSSNCIMSEFEDDIKHIKYVKRLLRKYKHTKVLKERLILNHLIILYNMFGTEATTRMLFVKIHPEDYVTLKTFLLFLNYMPDVVHGIFGNNILSADIPVDLHIVKVLRSI